jgi:hypothetical protein
VFDITVLRIIFLHKRDEKTGGWKEMHNEDLYNLYSSANIIRVVKLRRMRGKEDKYCAQNGNRKT